MQKGIVSAMVLFLALASCSPVKMAVHDDLKPAYDEYSVKGRQGILIKQKMSFGDYSTNTVKRSWTKGGSVRYGLGHIDQARQEWINIISKEYISRKQTIRYELNNGSLQSEVYCVSRFNAEDLQVGRRPNSLFNIGLDLARIGNSSSSMYYVQIFTSPEDGRPWEMAIDNQDAQARPRQYTGVLAKSKDEYYTIVPVNKLETKGKTGSTLFGSVGFEFRNKQGKTVAAVSMMDKGMIYLGKTTPEERFLLANACTALLLQEQIG